MVAVRQKVQYKVDLRPINTTVTIILSVLYICNDFHIVFFFRKNVLVSVVVCEFLLNSFAQIKVRSTSIHFARIVVMPA